ncbi:MAG: DUF302 domain-containing protein [Methylococcaceae bacterium]
MRSLKILLVVWLLNDIMACATQPLPSDNLFYSAQTTKPYDDILAELKSAIAEYNFRITGHSRVGKVIRERENIAFPEYDTIQFCNLSHAKKLLQFSPHAIEHMPCNVVIYAFEGRTVVKTRLLPTHSNNHALNEFSQQMNKTLKKIIDFAVED